MKFGATKSGDLLNSIGKQLSEDRELQWLQLDHSRSWWDKSSVVDVVVIVFSLWAK